MVTDLQTQPSQISIYRKQRRWCKFLLTPIAFLVLSTHANAQQVRTVRAPAPYNACNLRSQGGTQYNIIGTYRNGRPVTLLGESGRGWYRVQVGQQVGWMARQCLGL